MPAPAAIFSTNSVLFIIKFKLSDYFMLITLFILNSTANIGESIQKNNKNSEKIAFLLKKNS
jgi:hypothetical protein